jgi:hypothetical protein
MEMSWIAENWLVLLFGGGMLAMHLFGHGHGGKKKAQGRVNSPNEPSDATFEDPATGRRDRSQKPKIKLASVIEHAEFAPEKPKT